jgi:hypothetical protein
MSCNDMLRFLQNQGFDEYKANFIVNYTQLFRIFDVLELKDLETKILSEALPRFWSGLSGIPKKKLRMLIAWAKEECRIRSERGESTRWDGDARVNIEDFGRQWRAENINSEWRNLIMNQYAV